MTIRSRTERSGRRRGSARLAGALATAGLAGASAVHLAWARGSTWPAADADDLADLVMGRAPSDREPRPDDQGGRRRPATPDSAATYVVAGLLGAAAALTATSSGLVPVPDRAARLARSGTVVAAGVLLARGGGGLVVSAFDVVPTSERFRRWNLRLYSPLCLGLGGAAVLSSRGRRS